MKEVYKCDVCGMIFDHDFECMNHEKNCKLHVPVKQIMLEHKNKNYKIMIEEFPEAIQQGGFFKLKPEHYDWKDIQENRIIDGIYDDSMITSIYTTDFNQDFEKKCIERLIENEKKIIESNIASWQEDLKNIKKKIKIEKSVNKEIEK